MVIVVVAGSRAKPGAGLHGASLGVSLALAGFALAALAGFGALILRRMGAWMLLPVLGLLVVSSTVLVWLQPDGAGAVGMLIAVGIAARIVPGPSTAPTSWPGAAWTRRAGPSACSVTASCPAPTGWPR